LKGVVDGVTRSDVVKIYGGELISRESVSGDRYGLGGRVRLRVSQFSPADVGRRKKEAAPWRNAGWLGWSSERQVAR